MKIFPSFMTFDYDLIELVTGDTNHRSDLAKILINAYSSDYLNVK